MNNRNKPAGPQSSVDDEYFQNYLCETNGGAAVGLTKLEHLAMQIYVQECSNRPMDEPVSIDEYAQFSIGAANIFFDQLEKGNE